MDSSPESVSHTLHVPVMPSEVLHYLSPRPDGVYLDGTLGGGGHSELIAQQLSDAGRLIACDRDQRALDRCESRLRGLPVSLVQSNFCEMPEILDEIGVSCLDGILLDLGLSSDQLADRSRGFSFKSDGDLDLRFDTLSGEPAWKLLNRLSERHLADLIYQYGEERLSRRISRRIVEARRSRQLRSASEIADIVWHCYPSKQRHRIHPATRTFQALRIAVNNELESLEIGLRRLPDLLKPGGQLLIISFHSLEDRRVKDAFRSDDRLLAITKKAVQASETEKNTNPRSRSAKLRVAKRIE